MDGPVAVFQSACGETLVFALTVIDGDDTPDLAYTGSDALQLSGATIVGATGVAADVTLPVPGQPGSLSFNKDLALVAVESGTATVLSVTSPDPDGVYAAGQTITIAVRFTEAVDVTGTPQLLLETGETDPLATFTGGSGSDILTFTYTVQVGDANADLDYVSVDALTVPGGSVTAVASGRAADLTLPPPGPPGSLSANKNLLVDGSGSGR